MTLDGTLPDGVRSNQLENEMKKPALIALSALMVFGAAAVASASQEENLRLPASHAREYKYIGDNLDPDYQHATPEAREEFRDMKFGVRIHWGLYTIMGQRTGLNGESWMFHNLGYRKRQEYVDSYKDWNPTAFDADRWMKLFQDSGIRVFAITTKHHEGFSLFDTQTRVKRRVRWDAPFRPKIEDCDVAYSVMETPHKRDIIKELTDAGRKWGIKIDLYFSHPDWYDADFRPYSYHPLITKDWLAHATNYGWWYESLIIRPRLLLTPPPTAEERARMLARHRAQLLELVNNYGKIDMICLDMNMGPAVFPHLKETIKMIRKIQPQVMFRNRGIGNYGDYYTPEGFVPGDPANTDMPWMVIYPLGRSFSYEPSVTWHKGTKWIVTNLVDSCAKGGCFMVGIGPDQTGWFHPEAIKELLETGAWLKINGEGIYATRMWEKAWKEGDTRFTRTKDGKTVFAWMMKWPTAGAMQFRSNVLKPKAGSEVRMFGVDAPLKWRMDGDTLVVELPSKPPCDYVQGIKVEI